MFKQLQISEKIYWIPQIQKLLVTTFQVVFQS